MQQPEPALFYTGIVAEIYRHLRYAPTDSQPYAAFIAAAGEPALELGCGDGDPLLDLIESGLEVEGLDSSADMLDRCREAATRRGLDVLVHHSPIESMDLGRRFRSIFLAGPTFNLLPDDATALAALERIRDHLEYEGAALVPLFIPEADTVGTIGQSRETEVEGVSMRVTPLSVRCDEDERNLVTVMGYELVGPDRIESIERDWALHWYTQYDFGALAQRAGLEVVAILAPDGTAASPDATEFAFWLQTSR